MLSRLSPTAWLLSCLLGWASISAVASSAYAQLELSGPEQPVPPVPTAADPTADQAPDLVDAPDLPEGAEVMVTGPLHEAFAEQFSSQPEPGIIISKKPPELINEIPPEYRPDGEDIVWIPGYWGWDPEREDFLWITGIWRQAPPDRNWVPGYWAEVPEGYQWIAGFWSLNTNAEIRYLPVPPEPLAAEPSTPAPSEDHFWIPGQWSYANNNYQWRAGYWTMGYPDWVWVPDRYVWTPLGCIYRAGYWDYVVAERGTVFCPVYWAQPAPNYQFRPTYVVSTGPTLLANLFVYPRYNHYFFGNYYSSRYLNQSMYSWVSYGQQSRRYDPLYGYYRTQYRDTDYMNRLSRLHNYYAANVNYQPPRTLTAQRDHHYDIHDRQDLNFHAMQLNKMAGVHDNINHQMQLVKLAENERQQIQRGLDPARELWKQRAEIEAKNRPTTPGNPGKERSNPNGDRNGDGRPDFVERHWSLPSTQAGGRLGSVSVGQTNPIGDRDNRDNKNRDRNDRDRNDRDGIPGNNRADTNRDGVVDSRDGRTPDTRDRNPRDGKDRVGKNNNDPQNRNPGGRDSANLNPLDSNPQSLNPLNRDAQGRDNPNRNPLKGDGANKDPGNKDSGNRGPLSRDLKSNDGKLNPLDNDKLPNGNRQPRDGQPGVNPGTGIIPGNDRRPNDNRLLPGVGVPGSPITPNVPGRTGDTPLNRNNERERDMQNRTTGRTPIVPGTTPANVPNNLPKVTPGKAPGLSTPTQNNAGPGNAGQSNAGQNNAGVKNPGANNPGANERNRTPRVTPPSIAPGEPNPGASRRGAAGGPPANIQNDMQKMRETSQRQLQRRAESANTPRRAPQPPAGANKPEKGKDK